MISRTSKLLEIYDLHASEPQQNHDILSKMAYSDNPEVASSYSFQIYGSNAKYNICGYVLCVGLHSDRFQPCLPMVEVTDNEKHSAIRN